MPAKKKKIGVRKLKQESNRIIEELTGSSAMQVILDMDDLDYCRKRASEFLLQHDVSLQDKKWAINLLLYSIVLEREE